MHPQGLSFAKSPVDQLAVFDGRDCQPVGGKAEVVTGRDRKVPAAVARFGRDGSASMPGPGRRCQPLRSLRAGDGPPRSRRTRPGSGSSRSGAGTRWPSGRPVYGSPSRPAGAGQQRRSTPAPARPSPESLTARRNAVDALGHRARDRDAQPRVLPGPLQDGGSRARAPDEGTASAPEARTLAIRAVRVDGGGVEGLVANTPGAELRRLGVERRDSAVGEGVAGRVSDGQRRQRLLFRVAGASGLRFSLPTGAALNALSRTLAPLRVTWSAPEVERIGRCLRLASWVTASPARRVPRPHDPDYASGGSEPAEGDPAPTAPALVVGDLELDLVARDAVSRVSFGHRQLGALAYGPGRAEGRFRQ